MYLNVYLLTYNTWILTQCQTSIKRAFVSTMVEIVVMHYLLTNAGSFLLYDIYIGFAERPYNPMLQLASCNYGCKQILDPRARSEA